MFSETFESSNDIFFLFELKIIDVEFLKKEGNISCDLSLVNFFKLLLLALNK